MAMGKNNNKSKSIKIDNRLVNEIEVLCELLHTNFSTRVKELLVDWQIDKLDELKRKAPDLYQIYLDRTKQ